MEENKPTQHPIPNTQHMIEQNSNKKFMLFYCTKWMRLETLDTGSHIQIF